MDDQALPNVGPVFTLTKKDSADFDPNAIISRGDFMELVNGVLALYRAV